MFAAILCRTEPAERFLDAVLVVVDDIFLNHRLEFLVAMGKYNNSKSLAKSPREIFHHCYPDGFPSVQQSFPISIVSYTTLSECPSLINVRR